MQEITAIHGTREERYRLVIKQLESLFEQETDVVANMANTAALLKETFGWWWIGFYLVKEEELVLGPFQGPVACTRIGLGKGVCGAAWQQQQTIVVPDVEAFPGHIACSAASRSEIVVPLIKDHQVVAVLDADSEHLDHYDNNDALYLEKIAFLLQKFF